MLFMGKLNNLNVSYENCDAPLFLLCFFLHTMLIKKELKEKNPSQKLTAT